MEWFPNALSSRGNLICNDKKNRQITLLQIWVINFTFAHVACLEYTVEIQLEKTGRQTVTLSKADCDCLYIADFSV
jgi:hypothetical protein